MTEEEAWQIGEANLKLLKDNSSLKSLSLSNIDFIEFERKTKCLLSKGLKEFLLRVNGANLNSVYLLGIGKSLKGELRIDFRLDDKSYFLNDNIIPIATDGFGGYYAVIVKGKFSDAVVYCALEDVDKPSWFVASSLAYFLYFFTERELFERELIKLPRKEIENKYEQFYWPEDKEKVLSVDPDLSAISSFYLPWN